MAGTLVITTLSDGTNSTSATNCIQGSAKAWVNFNGTGTVAIRASYNVSSITDNGTGDYTVNFTNALANANYSASCASVEDTSGSGTPVTNRFLYPARVTPSASNIRLNCQEATTGAMRDMEFGYCAIFSS
jgi:hypothetical protein